MYVVVIGMGEVGRHILAQLEREQHDVIAIDTNAQHLAEVEETYDVGTLLGYGASQAVLKRAGVDKACLLYTSDAADE